MISQTPIGNRRTRSNLPRCIAAILLGACLTSAPVHAAKLRDIFPEFLARRASLDSVAVLADVVVIRQEGGTPVLHRTRTLAFGDSTLALTREMLEGNGIRIQRVLLASMGITYRGCRSGRASTWHGHWEPTPSSSFRVASWDVPIGKQFASLFDNSRRDMLTSSSFVGLTIISGEDGVVVWDDWISRQASLKPETLRDRMKALEKNIP